MSADTAALLPAKREPTPRAPPLRSASHVVILLVKKYPTYKIINYDKLDYCSSLKNLEEIADAPNYEFVKGDILAADLVNFLIRKEKVDTIMHFAAQSHVGEPRPERADDLLPDSRGAPPALLVSTQP